MSSQWKEMRTPLSVSRPAWARRGAAPEIQRNSAAKDITHAAKALQTSHFTLHTALFALQT